MKYKDFKREVLAIYWRALLAECGDNVTFASRISGVNRTDLYKHLKRLGVTLGRPVKRGNAAWQALSDVEINVNPASIAKKVIGNRWRV